MVAQEYRDYAEVMPWYDSTANIGMLYSHGMGIAKDENEALRGSRRAAGACSAAAVNNVGALYEFGQGVGRELMAHLLSPASPPALWRRMFPAYGGWRNTQ